MPAAAKHPTWPSVVAYVVAAVCVQAALSDVAWLLGMDYRDVLLVPRLVLFGACTTPFEFESAGATPATTGTRVFSSGAGLTFIS
jgi:hypothetical protein